MLYASLSHEAEGAAFLSLHYPSLFQDNPYLGHVLIPEGRDYELLFFLHYDILQISSNSKLTSHKLHFRAPTAKIVAYVSTLSHPLDFGFHHACLRLSLDLPPSFPPSHARTPLLLKRTLSHRYTKLQDGIELRFLNSACRVLKISHEQSIDLAIIFLNAVLSVQEKAIQPVGLMGSPASGDDDEGVLQTTVSLCERLPFPSHVGAIAYSFLSVGPRSQPI